MSSEGTPRPWQRDFHEDGSNEEVPREQPRHFSGIQLRVDSKPSHSVYECSSADTQSDCRAIRTAPTRPLHAVSACMISSRCFLSYSAAPALISNPEVNDMRAARRNEPQPGRDGASRAFGPKPDNRKCGFTLAACPLDPEGNGGSGSPGPTFGIHTPRRGRGTSAIITFTPTCAAYRPLVFQHGLRVSDRHSKIGTAKIFHNSECHTDHAPFAVN